MELSDVEPDLEIIALDDGNLRVGLTLEGEEVSRAFIIPMTVRYGVATLRMDGIGGVATEDEHRHKGYSRRVMEASVARMRSGPAGVSMLYGIRDFYPKYGYATLGPETAIELHDLDGMGEIPAGWEVRPARVEDFAAIRAIYDESTAEATGALLRADDSLSWSRLRESIEKDDGECRVAVDAAGTVEGYAWRASRHWWMEHWMHWSPAGLKTGEAFARDPLAADALLAGCAAWARALQQERISLTTPLDGHLAGAAMLRTSEVWYRFTRDGEFMGRVVGIQKLFRAIQPELTRVWALAAPGLTFRGVVLFDTGEDIGRLRLGDDGVEVIDEGADEMTALHVELGTGELARLVFGGLPTTYLTRLPGVTPAAVGVLTALFPHRLPYIYPPDRF